MFHRFDLFLLLVTVDLFYNIRIDVYLMNIILFTVSNGHPENIQVNNIFLYLGYPLYGPNENTLLYNKPHFLANTHTHKKNEGKQIPLELLRKND